MERWMDGWKDERKDGRMKSIATSRTNSDRNDMLFFVGEGRIYGGRSL